MYTSLLVPLDGSPQGEHALPVAVALARRSAAVVELVHVHPALAPSSGAPMYDTRFDVEVRGAMRRQLEAVAERLHAGAGVHVTATVLDGPTVPTLARYIEERRPALVVMTSHGHGGVSRVWLGSVAEALVRAPSSVPVLVVRPADGTAVPRDPGEPVFRRVLVPLDGSPVAEAVLDHAVNVAAPGATTFILVRVVPPVQTVAVDPSTGGVEFVSGEAGGDPGQAWHEAQNYLEPVAAEVRALGAEVTARVVVHAQPAHAILAVAAEDRADLIALATHGRGALARVVFGSVADKVLRGATAAVMLYHPAAPTQESTSGGWLGERLGDESLRGAHPTSPAAAGR